MLFDCCLIVVVYRCFSTCFSLPQEVFFLPQASFSSEVNNREDRVLSVKVDWCVLFSEKKKTVGFLCSWESEPFPCTFPTSLRSPGVILKKHKKRSTLLRDGGSII